MKSLSCLGLEGRVKVGMMHLWITVKDQRICNDLCKVSDLTFPSVLF